jgi:hypothetical protein
MTPFLSWLKNAYQESTRKRVERFAVMQGQHDGHALVAIIDMSLADYPERKAVPWFLGISVPLINPGQDGLPSKRDAAALNEWEDDIEKKVAKEGRSVFIGRATWNGSRELLFYIEKPQPLIGKLKELISAHSTRPFAFRCERDETWTNVAVYFEGPSK